MNPIDDLLLLPKVEVHAHLEGSVDESSLTAVPPQDVAALQAEGGFSDLASLLRYLDRWCDLFKTREQLEEAACLLSLRKGISGVRYVDLIFNPTHWPRWSERLDAMVDALDAGFGRGERNGGAQVKLLVSILRTQSSSEATALVERVAMWKHPRVVGISIDGNEAAVGRTGERFAPAFRRARELGLRRTTHAGESSGPEGVWDALDLLGTERIDHGVRSIEDPLLVTELARRGIPLTVCPLSNVRLGLYDSVADHPIERLRRAGVIVTVNTDDPVVRETPLEVVYKTVAGAFAWDRDTVARVAQSAVSASFADDTLKADLHAEIEAWRTAGPRATRPLGS